MYVRLVVHCLGPVMRSTILFATIVTPYIIGVVEIAELLSFATSVMYGWILGSSISYLVAHKVGLLLRVVSHTEVATATVLPVMPFFFSLLFIIY